MVGRFPIHVMQITYATIFNLSTVFGNCLLARTHSKQKSAKIHVSVSDTLTSTLIKNV